MEVNSRDANVISLTWSGSNSRKLTDLNQSWYTAEAWAAERANAHEMLDSSGRNTEFLNNVDISCLQCVMEIWDHKVAPFFYTENR